MHAFCQTGAANKMASNASNRQRNISSKISNSLKLRRVLFDASVMSDILPTFSVLPGRIFHRWIITGMLSAANAKNHMGFKNCIRLSRPLFTLYQKITQGLI
jgi:hypothetical protein